MTSNLTPNDDTGCASVVVAECAFPECMIAVAASGDVCTSCHCEIGRLVRVFGIDDGGRDHADVVAEVIAQVAADFAAQDAELDGQRARTR